MLLVKASQFGKPPQSQREKVLGLVVSGTGSISHHAAVSHPQNTFTSPYSTAAIPGTTQSPEPLSQNIGTSHCLGEVSPSSSLRCPFAGTWAVQRHCLHSHHQG